MLMLYESGDPLNYDDTANLENELVQEGILTNLSETFSYILGIFIVMLML